MFRLLKLAAYVSKYPSLANTLVASRRKIWVFLSAVIMLVVVKGAIMYVVEGPSHGFTSIPASICWAIHDHRGLGDRGQLTTRTCPQRLSEGHLVNAQYCVQCGAPLPDDLHEEQD